MAVDISSPQGRQLWDLYQTASSAVGITPRELGFLDIVVIGRQTSGKSSLLGALCGIKLPIGSGTVTKCPVRLMVDPRTTGISLHVPRQPPILLEDGALTSELYVQALELLSGGAMTETEIEIRIGDADHPPINLVDLPGIIIREDNMSRQSVLNMVQSQLRDSRNLPILVMHAQSDDIDSLRTDLLARRPFVAVGTHLDVVPKTTEGYKKILKNEADLKAAGCIGMYLVSVEGAVEKDAAWYESFCAQAEVQGLSAEEVAHLRRICGIANLRAMLQRTLLDHMLTELPSIAAKVQLRIKQLQGLVKGDLTKDNIKDEVQTQLLLIEERIREAAEQGKWSLGSTEPNIEKRYRLKEQASEIMDKFARDAIADVLDAVVEGWNSLDPTALQNNALFAHHLTLAQNLTAPGLVRVREHAAAASQTLLTLLRTFVLWRADSSIWDPVSAVFEGFLEEYLDNKSMIMSDFFDLANEELQCVMPNVHATSVYWALEGATGAELTTLTKYSEELTNALNATTPLPDIKPKYYRDEFQRDWDSMQRRTKLLAFLTAGELIDRFCRLMWNVVFKRTCTAMTTSAWHHGTLAFLSLSTAFSRHVRAKGLDYEDWVDVQQVELADKLGALKTIRDALKALQGDAALAASRMRHLQGPQSATMRRRPSPAGSLSLPASSPSATAPTTPRAHSGQGELLELVGADPSASPKLGSKGTFKSAKLPKMFQRKGRDDMASSMEFPLSNGSNHAN